MRQYTLSFMEQLPGVSRLTRVEGTPGTEVFNAPDDDAALAFIAVHHTERLARCVRGELSSMYIMTDPTASAGTRLVDDYCALPYSHDMYVVYNAVTKTVECEWESTRTGLLAERLVLR